MQPHKFLTPLFGSISAINTQQNLAILSQGNSMDPFSVTKKKNEKSGLAMPPRLCIHIHSNMHLGADHMGEWESCGKLS